MKKNIKKRKSKFGENNLEEPLKEEIELNIINNETFNENKYINNDIKELNKNKVSFCSRLFFLWTLIIMKLSNKKKLKKEYIRESPLFTNNNEQIKFNEDFKFIKELWEGKKIKMVLKHGHFVL